MESEEWQKTIIERLNILIALNLDATATEDLPTMKSKILRLHELGLPPSEIGQILGKATNYVSAVLSKAEARGD